KAWNFYYEHLWTWAQRHQVQLPVVPPHTEQSYHMFYILLPTEQERDALIAHLKKKGILSVFHYLPLHLSNLGRSLDPRNGICPVTEDISKRLTRLPFFNDITEPQQSRVVDALLEFYRTRVNEHVSFSSQTKNH